MISRASRTIKYLARSRAPLINKIVLAVARTRSLARLVVVVVSYGEREEEDFNEEFSFFKASNHISYHGPGPVTGFYLAFNSFVLQQ